MNPKIQEMYEEACTDMSKMLPKLRNTYGNMKVMSYCQLNLELSGMTVDETARFILKTQKAFLESVWEPVDYLTKPPSLFCEWGVHEDEGEEDDT